jgi:hypothetical protein
MSAVVAALSSVLTGCARAPSIDVLGSFFPVWMVCVRSRLPNGVPLPLGQATSWDPEFISEAAREASLDGIHWTFAPMLDIARDPRWGRIAESLGEDPY